jgi:hypothetical protein
MTTAGDALRNLAGPSLKGLDSDPSGFGGSGSSIGLPGGKSGSASSTDSMNTAEIINKIANPSLGQFVNWKG